MTSASASPPDCNTPSAQTEGDQGSTQPPACPLTDDNTDNSAGWLGSITHILRLTLGLTVIGLMVWLLGDVLTILFAATLFAVVLHGLSKILVKHLRLPYGWSLTAVVAALIAAVGLLIWGSGPAIVSEAAKLQDALRQQEASLRATLQTSPTGQMILNYLPASLGGNQGGSGSSLASLGSRIAGSMTGILGSAFGAAGTIVVILIAGLYFAMDPGLYANGALRLVPVGQRPRARTLMLHASQTLWAWVAGQSLDMLVVGVLSGVGLWFIGVPLALALGVLAGLCNFIPYIGAIMGAVPALLLALSLGTRETIMVAVLYSVIQFFEGNVLAPVIQRHAVQMPPAITVLSQTLFGAILGFPGLIFASPLTAALLSIFDGLTPPLSDDERV
ncbi:AI-2E family transporter [Acetobacter malorum]|uniref:Transporter n=1 Tax=Acetobacter malorum TaxID=178901 RepID=A0A087PJL0_9PROT|nr:AI-2E family transporter [Acetobacter malorum]KFL87563.1 putative permease [Acetobacter malorum]KXV14380.1 transporter [Acetobacter malorum]